MNTDIYSNENHFRNITTDIVETALFVIGYYSN